MVKVLVKTLGLRRLQNKSAVERVGTQPEINERGKKKNKRKEGIIKGGQGLIGRVRIPGRRHIRTTEA
jgi:hypothetical protein